MQSNWESSYKLLRGGGKIRGKQRRDVFISFFVQGVHKIDVLEQRFHASFIMYAAWDVSLEDIVLGKEEKDCDGKWHINWTDSDGKLHHLPHGEQASWRESMFQKCLDPQLTFPNCVEWTRKEKKWYVD